jgi:hypothetical protein
MGMIRMSGIIQPVPAPEDPPQDETLWTTGEQPEPFPPQPDPESSPDTDDVGI